MGTSCLITYLFFLLFLCLGLHRDWFGFGLGFASGCQTAEREALLKLKHSLGDPEGRLSSWKGADCCGWSGVRCNNNVTGHIHHLDLRNSVTYHDAEDGYGSLSINSSYELIAPKLDASVVELRHLRYLDLSGNNFQGSPIPKFIGSLKHLRYLNLSFASFGGVVPPQLGNLTKLQVLDLCMHYSTYYMMENNLNWVARLSSLVSLNMGSVSLDEAKNSMQALARLPALLDLRLSLCFRDANITHAFYNASWLSALEALDLSSNDLDASFLPFFTKMTSLRFLDLSYVDLGMTQSSIGVLNKLPSLLHLHFPGCNFGNTHLSHVFHNSTWLSTLKSLDLSSNDLAGPLPHFFSNMSSLRYLDLSSNHFNGSIPLGLRNMRSLESIYLRENSFDHVEGGTVMGTMGNLCKLKLLDFSHNGIEGEIIAPHENVSHCSSTYALESLDLFSNAITGTLPNWLGELRNLKYLNLGYNRFLGPIPASIGNLTLLEELYLSKNGLFGSIALPLGGLSSLKLADLSSNSLEGSLSHMHLANLSSSYLENLDLSSNRFTGNLPHCLGELQNLRDLVLQDNRFSGQIPSSIGSLSFLEALDLSKNNLSGNIPQSLGRLASLAALDLSHNQLRGQIPKSIGRCNKLGDIDLSSNFLEGMLSNSHLANLSVLRSLDLSDNFLRGQIPDSLGRCSWLSEIDLSSNLLAGLVSESHFANLSNLESLDLSSNSLNLNLSSNWTPPFQLSDFRMSSCSVQGQLPQWILTQNDLSNLDLSKNEISGEMPEWTWKLSVDSIDLSHNCITGPIPQFPFFMYSIDLSHNFLSGPLPQNVSATTDGPGPTSLCQLGKLNFLYLQNNSLSGTIPSNCWSHIGGSLYAINLSFNKLRGPLPMSVGQLLEISFLNLNNNALEGKIPPTLSKCRELVILDLGDNMLSGEVPRLGAKSHPNLRILRLRGNQLGGFIPPQLCALPELQILDLANNNLSGRIPQCFGRFSSMELHLTAPTLAPNVRHPYPDTEDIMEVLKGMELHYTRTLEFVQNMDLSCNRLVGSIPEELTNLSGLVGLNLSYNHLTGRIPEKIGDMKYLESLDLSNNNLSGIIPQTMSALSSLSHLNLSHNKLHGEIPTGPQLQTLNDPSIYANNPGLCGDPLPNKCTRDHSQQPGGSEQGQEQEEEEEDNREKVLFYIVIILGFGTGFWGVVGTLVLKKNWRYALFRRVEDIMDYLYVQMVVRINRLRR